MGHRLSKIYTRTGDDGSTGLGNGQRTGKDSLRIDLLGSLDEANACLGLLCTALPADAPEALLIIRLQHQLFDLGGELCLPGHAGIFADDSLALEQYIDHCNAQLTPLKEFILPGGNEAAARCHLARTVVRRAERLAVALSRHEAVRPEALRYLNRLSDALFVLARQLARRDGGSDVLWQPAHRRATTAT